MPLMDNFSGMGFPFGDLFDEQPRRQQRRPVHGHPFFGYQGQDEDDMYHPSRRQQQEQQISAQREQMRLRNQQRQQVLQQRAQREQALRERAAHEQAMREQAMREQYMLQQQQVQEQLMRQRQEQEQLRQRVQEQSEDSDDSVSFVSDHSEEDAMPELMPLVPDEEMPSVSDIHDCEAAPAPEPEPEPAPAPAPEPETTTAASEPGPVETARHEPEEKPVEMPADAEDDFVDAMSDEPENKPVASEPEAPEEQGGEEEEPTSPALTPEQLESQQEIEKVRTAATALTERWKGAFTALGSDKTENERITMARKHYDEGLLQLELKLDNVMTHGSMNVRAARKQTINSIEECISTLKDFAKLYDHKQ